MALGIDVDDATTLAPLVSASENALSLLSEASTEASRRYAGLGSARAAYHTFLSGFDRFGNNPLPPNNEVVGLTLFTRPKLCLASANISMNRVMRMMDTVDPYRLEFSIRAYLDSKWARNSKFSGLVSQCPFVNSESPFIVPLSNGLWNFSGFPDFFIDTVTTEGGFYAEDQTIATGSDFNRRSYDFSVTFQDIQSGYLMSLFYFWLLYIALVRNGTMVAYMEDIVAARLNYTCSIYRLILDPSRRTVTKWCKATGCYPKSIPFGAAFDIPDRENYIHGTQQFTVPFQCSGGVEYMDPIILKEFNMLIDRWAGNPVEAAARGERVEAPVTAFANFTGIPYINLNGFNELKFWAKPEELEDPSNTLMNNLLDGIQSMRASLVSADSVGLTV